MKSLIKTLSNGILRANPTFILLLGLCPTLAVSTSIDNAFGMTGSVLFVLLAANVIVSILRRWIPDRARIPTFIVIIATLVTIVDLAMKAYVPSLSKSLGMYVPLIVVNCIILGRAEAFASKNSVIHSIADAVGMSLGFGVAILLISFVRQVLGSGKLEIFNVQLFSVPGLASNPAAIFLLPMGAFFVIGVLLALFRWMGVSECE
ncbi:electron transport complex subunit RsxE [Candidatus Bipolaricaulota bacterium]|nr:electron transport complex subunit RsxE [Candidatus Bipolaricaulota bacterium]